MGKDLIAFVAGAAALQTWLRCRLKNFFAADYQ